MDNDYIYIYVYYHMELYGNAYTHYLIYDIYTHILPYTLW